MSRKLWGFFAVRIAELRATGRAGTADNYAKTERCFRTFLISSSLPPVIQRLQ